MVRPDPLKRNDRVALIAPSSPLSKSEVLMALDSISYLGLNPIAFPSCYMREDYLSGSDKARAKDMNNAFADPSIKGIFCLRGGYGAMRILPLLDFKTIAGNPKFFSGYSDITALHNAINKLCGFVTYHAPMPSENYKSLDEFTLKSLNEAVFGSCLKGRKLENPTGVILKTVYPGMGSGELIGGNLSVIAATLGSPYDIDTDGKILFVEDVNEPLYRIDRCLTSLRLAGKFDYASGLILGAFNIIPSDKDECPWVLSLAPIYENIILPLKIPTVANFQCGHVLPQVTVPIGTKAKLYAADNCAEIILQYA
jgi:muramoyltetrapeptide carboxypeptidase